VGVREGLAGGRGAVGELALADSVPQLNGLISAARNDLAVVCAEGDREDIRGVACRRKAKVRRAIAQQRAYCTDKGASGVAGSQVPKPESTIPRARQSELAIRRDNNVLEECEQTAKAKWSDHHNYDNWDIK
jgi:hypothetical protein